MKYFIGVITKQVVERHLVDPLPDNVLSPMLVLSLSDDEVKYIAGEPKEITDRRNHLEKHLKMLESGQETFRLAMGGLR